MTKKLHLILIKESLKNDFLSLPSLYISIIRKRGDYKNDIVVLIFNHPFLKIIQLCH